MFASLPDDDEVQEQHHLNKSIYHQPINSNQLKRNTLSRLENRYSIGVLARRGVKQSVRQITNSSLSNMTYTEGIMPVFVWWDSDKTNPAKNKYTN